MIVLESPLFLAFVVGAFGIGVAVGAKLVERR